MYITTRPQPMDFMTLAWHHDSEKWLLVLIIDEDVYGDKERHVSEAQCIFSHLLKKVKHTFTM